MIETVKLVDGTQFKGNCNTWKSWDNYRYYKVIDKGNSSFGINDIVRIRSFAIVWRKQEK